MMENASLNQRITQMPTEARVVLNDAIAIRHRAYLSLSYDHRLVDGAMAEMFMASIKQFIEAGNVQ